MGADTELVVKSLESYLNKFISIVQEVTRVNTQMISNQKELRAICNEIKINMDSNTEVVKLVKVLLDPNDKDSLTNIIREIKQADLAKTVTKLRYFIWSFGIIWSITIAVLGLLLGFGIIGGA